jgi:hypothetical protein
MTNSPGIPKNRKSAGAEPLSETDNFVHSRVEDATERWNSEAPENHNDAGGHQGDQDPTGYVAAVVVEIDYSLVFHFVSFLETQLQKLQAG